MIAPASLCRLSAGRRSRSRLHSTSLLRVDRVVRPLRWAGGDIRFDVPALRDIAPAAVAP